jgi:hypothetical protein
VRLDGCGRGQLLGGRGTYHAARVLQAALQLLRRHSHPWLRRRIEFAENQYKRRNRSAFQGVHTGVTGPLPYAGLFRTHFATDSLLHFSAAVCGGGGGQPGSVLGAVEGHPSGAKQLHHAQALEPCPALCSPHQQQQRVTCISSHAQEHATGGQT